MAIHCQFRVIVLYFKNKIAHEFNWILQGTAPNFTALLRPLKFQKVESFLGVFVSFCEFWEVFEFGSFWVWESPPPPPPPPHTHTDFALCTTQGITLHIAPLPHPLFRPQFLDPPLNVWGVVAERSSLPDSSSGVSSRMWVRIPAVTLVSLSKTLNHNCFSPPRG